MDVFDKYVNLLLFPRWPVSSRPIFYVPLTVAPVRKELLKHLVLVGNNPALPSSTHRALRISMWVAAATNDYSAVNVMPNDVFSTTMPLGCRTTSFGTFYHLIALTSLTNYLAY